MLSHNSLFDASSTIFKEVSEEQFSKLQPMKQEDDCSSNGSTPSSPRQNWCSKNGYGIMTVMTIGTTSLEEQVALLAKSVESLTASLKEKDDQIAFLMINLSEKKNSTVEEQDPIHGEGGENSLKKIIKASDQQKVSELINPSQQKVNVASMLDELLKSKVIELREMKRPEESGKVDDPNYCKYHRLVSHLVEKCFVLKDKIMELHSEGLIEFEEAVASSNLASITRVIPEYEVLTMAIKFGSFEPIILPVASTKLATSQQTGGSYFSETNEDEDNEGWTLVTRHRAKKNHPKCVKVLETQKKAHQLISKPEQTLV
ncbi:hypothetical protein COLO4_26688 [Corchorus olitorius]|uniref:Retrotransposon gag protein n=1 Tax=Corchorus olitorius TaxID=93759 RepID=A0A1R3HUV8_9ROSI|nr:hypothetical protein COLO4_26688 [Corchorus olitorius]